MCCFSGPVEYVSNTKIFARSENGHQVLAYEMSLGTRAENAMILPIPVAAGGGEKAVRFVSLEGYPEFFNDMERLFPKVVTLSENTDSRFEASAGAVLEVHAVGAYEASYVPSIQDFERLDPRFRLPTGVWARLPKYQDYGFSVFQLKPGRMEVHPMAFRFETRCPGCLFFPTVHIHDGTVHAMADFDHTLYAQKGEEMSWERSLSPAKETMQTGLSLGGIGDKTQGLVVRDLPVYRRIISGNLPNRDVEMPGWEPAPMGRIS